MEWEKEKEFVLSKENIADALRIWEYTSINLIDIRHNLISPGEVIKGYQIPSSIFIYTSGGKAQVSLNHTSYEVERFGVFHAGKGTELTIQPKCEYLECYMILYRAGEPSFFKKELTQLLKRTDPFRQQYGFSTNNPIFFLERLRTMYDRWREGTPLYRFYGKTSFYQLVYEIYEELEMGHIYIFQPDYGVMARYYIDKHYNKSISIAAIAEILGISTRQLARVFRETTGKSTKEYLMDIRLRAARDLLLQTNATLSEIASANGFNDEFYFSRSFKSHFGVSPLTFRRNCSWRKSDLFMGNLSSFSYNEESLVSLGELNEEGVDTMFKQIKNKAVIAAAVSMLLLFSGCSSAASVNNNTDNTSNQTVVTQESKGDTQETKGETRTITTVKGEVEVPANPQRVIVHYLMGDAIAMGINPVGVSEVHSGAAFEENIKEAVNLGSWDFEIESVMTLEPDLIITVNEGQYEELSKVAPTVYVPYGTMTTEERLTFLGEVFNKQEEAQKTLEDYEEKIEEAKAKLKENGLESASVTILQTQDKGNSVAGSKHALGILVYKELGLIPPQKVQEEIIDADEYWGQPSLEILEEYCGDYLIHLGEIPESVSSNDVWNLIPAVKDGRVIITDTALTYYTDVVSSGVLIDEIVDNIITLSK